METKSIDYFKALEAAIHSIVIIDAKGLVLMANKATCQLFGYSSEEIVGQNVKKLMPPEISSKHDSYLSDYRETKKASIIGTGREVEAMKSDGQKFKVLLSVSEVENEIMFLGIMQDLSSQYALESKMRIALQALEFGMWELNISSFDEVKWDAGMLSLYELDSKSFNNSYDFWLQKIHPEDRVKFKKNINSAIKQKKSFETIFRINTPNKTKFIQLFANYLYNENNQLSKLVGISWDVTEKVKLENYILKISEIQNKYLKEKKIEEAFQEALKHTLDFSNSQFGFIIILNKYSKLVKTFFLDSKDKNVHAIDLDSNIISEPLKRVLFKGEVKGSDEKINKSLAEIFAKDLNISNYITIPIFDNDKNIAGCLGIINSNNFHMKQIVELLQPIISSIGAIVSSNQQYNEIARLANKDSLTGLYSRHFFEKQLDEEFWNYLKVKKNCCINYRY